MRGTDSSGYARERYAHCLSGIWGFMEATLFFLVPDIWTSIVGRSRLKAGLQACLVAAGGAIIGGTLMYYWGSTNPLMAEALLEKVPAISESMMQQARQDLEERGGYALFFGPLRVTPYKVFAIYSHGAGIGFPLFIVVSILSRLLRFSLTTVFCHFALKLLPLLRLPVNPLPALIVGWIVFYIFFFTVLPS